MAERLGFVVVEVNQASGRPNLLFAAALHEHEDDAELEAQAEREDTASVGRRERYVVCEVVPVEDGDG